MPMSPSRAFARTVSESMRTPILSLGATSSSIACMIEGTPAITITLPIQKPGAPDTLLTIRSAPLGRRVMRRRASLISAPVVFTHLCRMASARGSVSSGTPNAFATQAAVFLEINAERREIFCNIAFWSLVRAGQVLATDH